MPELPDIVVYVDALTARIRGQPLEAIEVRSPSLLRSVDPPLREAVGRRVIDVGRLGKRITIALDGDFYLVLHLMIGGRLHWRAPDAKIPGKVGLAAFRFPMGAVVLTEPGKHRASLVVLRGAAALAALDPGGLEVLESTRAAFGEALTRESHTVKRALTDPRILSGVGNAYSDEILHAAKLSPFKLTPSLSTDELARLHEATQRVLHTWIERLRRAAGGEFPEKVTAFREGMAVHGRYGQPCPVCGSPIQRVRYAQNEMNYCATCQTGGTVFADRSLSRLLKADWPRSLEEWEALALSPSPSSRGPRGAKS
jgi:formamidopyrimidine-DNA glycosylase